MSMQFQLCYKAHGDFGPRVQAQLFFSAHGVPKSYVDEAGDPYKEEMEECVALIMNELKQRGVPNDHTLAYQSRVGPVEWLKPYTDDSIRALGEQGCKSLLAVPISFVSEHIETLEEIDMEYRELAEESGIEHWGRVPALNVNPTFIGDLADAVIEALPYVGAMIGSTESLVPLGQVEKLLAVYDDERRQLPTPENLSWQPGWTSSSEAWNGRIAMIALVIIVLLEAFTGRSVFGDLFFSSVRPWL
jgi:protoporphyrin/coproporphyrin ferrochelatase